MSLKRSSGSVPGFGSGDPDNWLSALFRRPSGETPHALDDEFDDASIHGDWTELVINGTTTWTEQLGRLSALTTNQSDANTSPILKSIGAASYPLTIDTCTTRTSVKANYLMYGIIFSDGVTATDDGTAIMPYQETAEAFLTMGYRSGTLQNMGTNPGVGQIWAESGLLYLRMIWSAADTFKAYWSADGIEWLAHPNSPVSRTLTPTHAGLWVSSWGTATTSGMSFEYFRVTASDLSA